MRETQNDRLDTLLSQRRFLAADPDLQERIILKAQRVRRVRQRGVRGEKRTDSHARLIVKR